MGDVRNRNRLSCSMTLEQAAALGELANALLAGRDMRTMLSGKRARCALRNMVRIGQRAALRRNGSVAA